MKSWRIDAIKSLCYSRLYPDSQKPYGVKFKDFELIKLKKINTKRYYLILLLWLSDTRYESFIMYSRISVCFYRFFTLLRKCHMTLRNFWKTQILSFRRWWINLILTWLHVYTEESFTYNVYTHMAVGNLRHFLLTSIIEVLKDNWYSNELFFNQHYLLYSTMIDKK